MDLDSSPFLRKNPIIMSVQVMVIPLGITTTWTDPDGHKDGIFREKYRAVQVHFGEVVLQCITYRFGHDIMFAGYKSKQLNLSLP